MDNDCAVRFTAQKETLSQVSQKSDGKLNRERVLNYLDCLLKLFLNAPPNNHIAIDYNVTLVFKA